MKTETTFPTTIPPLPSASSLLSRAPIIPSRREAWLREKLGEQLCLNAELARRLEGGEPIHREEWLVRRCLELEAANAEMARDIMARSAARAAA